MQPLLELEPGRSYPQPVFSAAEIDRSAWLNHSQKQGSARKYQPHQS